MSDKERQTMDAMAESIKSMDDSQCAVAMAFVEGMRAQKQMQKDE